MATNFPTSIDTYSNVADGNTIQIATTNNMQDAIEALEAKVGIDSSADTDSHDYKIGAIETILGSASTADLTKLHGVTATADELNILDGVTSTKDELNILDGVTANKDELNILDGVTGSTAEINSAVNANKAATTTGDLLVKGSSAIERLAAVAATQYLKSAGTSTKPAYGKLSLSDTGVAIGSFSTSTTTVTTGFEPSVVIFLSAPNDLAIHLSIGFDDGTNHKSVNMIHEPAYGTRQIRDTDYSIHQQAYGNDPITKGYISAKSSTGFTLTWDYTGYTTNGTYLALP